MPMNEMPMNEKSFDPAFLARLAQTMGAIAQEAAEAADPAPLQAEDYDAIYAAYEDGGGDSAAAKQRLGCAREQCDQALARILQYIADQYGMGPVESLEKRMLADVARDAFDATEYWLDEVVMHTCQVTPHGPLQTLLEAHCRLNDALLALHDEILWPIARRIYRSD
jgi:GAF domain-containing protein